MNDDRLPFYFALPLKTETTPSQARLNIATNYGVHGEVQHVSDQDTFRLYRIVGAVA